MASTGLLSGVNPYKGGNVAIDFVSKPLEYVMKDLAHQEAKAEAFEKYYKDKEKTLNSAGLTKDEQGIFTKMLQDYKDFSIKNKNQIYYPSINGYDKQSEADVKLRDLSNYLDEAKQNAGFRKAFGDVTTQQINAGKDLPENYQEIYDNVWKPTGAGFTKPPVDLKFIDKYNPKKHTDYIYGNIKIPEKVEWIPEEVMGKDGKKIKTDREMKQTSTYLTDDIAKDIGNNGIMAYNALPEVKRRIDRLYNNEQAIKDANEDFKKYYHRDIKSLEDFIKADAIMLKQTGIEKTGEAEYRDPSWYQKNAITNNQANARSNAQINATNRAAAASIETIINNARTGKKFADNPSLEQMDFNPKIKDAYKIEIELPTNKLEAGKKAKGGKYASKKTTVYPNFGAEGEDIIIAYPMMEYVGQTDAKTDWKNSSRKTGDIKATILEKQVPSKYKANVVASFDENNDDDGYFFSKYKKK